MTVQMRRRATRRRVTVTPVVTAPQYQSHAYSGGGGGATRTVPIPAGVAAGDVILVYIAAQAAFPSPNSLPTGFAEITAGMVVEKPPVRQFVFWKRATTSETGTWTFGFNGSAWRDALAVRFSGTKATGTPYEWLGWSASEGATTATPPVSGTTTGPNELVVWCGHTYEIGAWTPPSGFTENADNSSNISVATKQQATAGPTGSIVGTSPNSDRHTNTLLALLPNT